MEVFQTNDFYIFVNGEFSLWWDRETGTFIPKTGWDLTAADDPTCLGICDGIIGKIYHPSILDPRLLLIKESVSIGQLHGTNDIYRIKSITFLALNGDITELSLKICPKHRTNNRNVPSVSLFDKNAALRKTWGTIKNAGSTIKNTTQQAAAIASMGGTPKRRDFKDNERQILEEFYKIFSETNSFYFSRTTDLTNSLQRLCNLEINEECLWKTVEDRFFWNKYMLQDLITLDNPLCDPWILPIIQGYIQIEQCKVSLPKDFQNTYEIFTLCIISRRSRFRAGTRYKRRGVDEDGECANYVETEQMVIYKSHEVSFVQVRGSVPIYWSQPGYKYRPPPRLDKGEIETKQAFEKHLSNEIHKYGPVCAINLIDQTGKERVIFDAYSTYVLNYNSPFITYATFDFHEYCRGMHFENVSILINALADVIKDMNYCWRDKQGHICSQNGVFRVNCIDCLDRTNVVQTALGKAVMEMQFCKLGLITPEGTMPESIKSTFQLLWANNGDIISRQYAGTNALKGDYTRTGERKFSGIMKDGMNSANRYYLSRFKDSTRQGTIDLMLGNTVTEDNFTPMPQFEEDTAATAEHVKLLIEDCKKMLISNPEMVLGAWGLINADLSTGDPNETEMDTILILTKDSYYVVDYDDQVDKVTKYQKVFLQDVYLLEFGIPEGFLFKVVNRNRFCIRINYKVDQVSGFYHMFRSTSLRFFNNMAVMIKNDEEEKESLKAICEAFVVAADISGFSSIPFSCVKSLERRKSKVLNTIRSNIYLEDASYQMPRNVSESQLLSIKNAGSKALSNMTKKFSKLNRSFNKTNRPNFTIGTINKESSSDTDDDYENSIFQPEPPDDDTFLPSVGIVMGDLGVPPEIQISLETRQMPPPPTLKLDKKFSHSSGEVDDYENNFNIAQSQSESALKSKLSPMATATKDLVFSPLSKFARQLGANLDPRKLGQVRQVNEKDLEEHRKLQEKWQNSKTRLIAL